MSWLYIDTRQKDQSQVAWLCDDGKIIPRKVNGRGKEVLKAISKDWDTHAKSLKGVIVVSGPGAFSSIRTGVLYANLFSRFLGLPLYGIETDGILDLEHVHEEAKAGKLKKRTYIEPVYDREPNITVPKS